MTAQNGFEGISDSDFGAKDIWNLRNPSGGFGRWYSDVEVAVYLE